MNNLFVQVIETPGASEHYDFKHFCFNVVKSIKISAMVDNWINIEDDAGMLDCEIDEVVGGK